MEPNVDMFLFVAGVRNIVIEKYLGTKFPTSNILQ